MFFELVNFLFLRISCQDPSDMNKVYEFKVSWGFCGTRKIRRTNPILSSSEKKGNSHTVTSEIFFAFSIFSNYFLFSNT
jgi:hypothetical protein